MGKDLMPVRTSGHALRVMVDEQNGAVELWRGFMLAWAIIA
jgi:hypothetical protein